MSSTSISWGGPLVTAGCIVAIDVAKTKFVAGIATDVDVKSCARCGGRLEVRAVVTDHDIARKTLDAIPTAARAPPAVDTAVVYEPAFA